MIWGKNQWVRSVNVKSCNVSIEVSISFCLPQHYRGLYIHWRIQYLVKICWQILLHSEKCFTYCHFYLDGCSSLQDDVGAKFDTRGPFFTFIWRRGGEFSLVLTLNLNLRCVNMSMIVWQHKNSGRQSWSRMPLNTSVTHVQVLYTEKGLFGDVEDISCPVPYLK